MSTINPKKLKVAELREELQNRGLDTKGTKPILVKRLEEALIEEGAEAVGDSSTLDESALDTSTADTTADTSTLAEESAVPATESADVPADDTEATPEITDAAPVQDTAVTPAEDEAITSSVAEENTVAEEDKPCEELTEDEPQEYVVQDDEEMEESNKPEAEKEEEASPPESARQEEEESAADMAPEAEQQEAEAPEDMQQEAAPEVSQQDDAPEDEAQQQDEDALLDEDDQPEEFQVMDSVGDDMDAPEADQFTEHSGERRATKRRHDDERRHDEERERRRDEDRDRRRHGQSPRSHRSSADREESSRHHRHRSHSPPRRRSPSADRQPSEPEESDDWLTATNVQLDRYNSDLSLRFNDEGYKCTPFTFQGFAYMWGGVRSTYGVKTGKIAFEVKVLEHMKAELPEEEASPHVVRVGFSTDSSQLQLGEVANSYGYGGTAKSSLDCKFSDYGQKFGEGDVVTAYLDFESSPPEISFARNGEDQGKCFDVDVDALGEQALFPHVLTKNCEFEVNFGQKEEPYFPIKEGFTWVNAVSEEDRVRGSVPPAKKEDCEILMMCGLPGSGKTYWAAKHVAEHPEQKHYILGTNSIIDKMKVMGLPRKKNYAGRWEVLIEKATKSLNKLFAVACRKKRNYILDQTNVYPSAQRRKMRPFEGYQRKAIVLVPEEEEFKRRCEERMKVEGKDVPDSAVLEMKANFQLPETGSLFDEVEFVELPREEAQKLVETYNEEGKAALPPEPKRWRNDRPSGGPDYRGGRDNRGGYDNRDRRGGYNRDRGFDNRRGGGWGNYDDRRRTASGGYMGYSSNDRRRMESHRGGSYRDNRDYRRDSRDSRSYGDRSRGASSGYRGQSGGWGGQQSWGSQGWGGSGGQGHWNQSNWGSQQGAGGYQQGQWGSSGQWGSYGNQGGWGQQNQSGWGQGYNYGNQSGGSSQQGSGQSWGSSGYGSNYSGWGNK